MSTYTLNVTREHCPMTFVRTKIQLSKLRDGDILEVLVNKGEPLDNIPSSAIEQGYRILSVSESETKDQYKIVIQK